jgi:hypothetical protein
MQRGLSGKFRQRKLGSAFAQYLNFIRDFFAFIFLV